MYVSRQLLDHHSKMSRSWKHQPSDSNFLPEYTISWVLFIIFIGDDIHFIIWHHEQAMPSEFRWAHHHGCHSSHQIWTLPIVPFNAIVANHTGWGRVIYAVQVGWATSLKPPTWRRGNLPESSRKKSELIEFKLMKCNIQSNSCKSAVTLYWRRGKMKCTWGHLQGGG